MGGSSISPGLPVVSSHAPRHRQVRKLLECGALPSRVSSLGGSPSCRKAVQTCPHLPERSCACSRRTSVRQYPPRLDGCHETRTKQAIARPRQREQSSLRQPPADASTESDV